MGLHLLSPMLQHAAGAHKYGNAHIDNKIYLMLITEKTPKNCGIGGFKYTTPCSWGCCAHM